MSYWTPKKKESLLLLYLPGVASGLPQVAHGSSSLLQLFTGRFSFYKRRFHKLFWLAILLKMNFMLW